jgi:hypothetical protein
MFGKNKKIKAEEDLTKEHTEIIEFLKRREIKFLEIEDTEGMALEEFDDFIKEKLNLTNALKWKNENFLEFIKKMNELGSSLFYISSPFVLDEYFEESEEFKSQKLLSKHEGETPFVIVSCFLGGVNHYCEKFTEWYCDAKEHYKNGNEENQYESDGFYGGLTEKEKERYSRQIIVHPKFKEFNKNQNLREMFIKEFFPEIYKKLGDSWKISELTRFARDKYDFLKSSGQDMDNLKFEESLEEEDDGKEVIETKTFCCPKCEEEFELEIDKDDNLEEGVLTDCPKCDKEIEVFEDDLVDSEWENLTDKDIEDYAFKVIKHPKFPKGEVNSEDILKFIKKYLEDICDELDEDGLNLIADKVETKTYFGEDQ